MLLVRLAVSLERSPRLLARARRKPRPRRSESTGALAFRRYTRRPDLYTAAIDYQPQALCLESKSLKLYLSRFRNEGCFCEALAVRIRGDVAGALELPDELVRVTLTQKARGGITIEATA